MQKSEAKIELDKIQQLTQDPLVSIDHFFDAIKALSKLCEFKAVVQLQCLEQCGCEHSISQPHYFNQSNTINLYNCPKKSKICKFEFLQFVAQLVKNPWFKIDRPDDLVFFYQKYCPECTTIKIYTSEQQMNSSALEQQKSTKTSEQHWNIDVIFSVPGLYKEIKIVIEDTIKHLAKIPCDLCCEQYTERDFITLACQSKLCKFCMKDFLDKYPAANQFPKNQKEMENICLFSHGPDDKVGDIHLTESIIQISELFDRIYKMKKYNSKKCPKCNIIFSDDRNDPVSRYCVNRYNGCDTQMCLYCDGHYHGIQVECPLKVMEKQNESENQQFIIQQVREGNFFICPNCQICGVKNDTKQCNQITCLCKTQFSSCCSFNQFVISAHSAIYHRKGCYMREQLQINEEVELKEKKWEKDCPECAKITDKTKSCQLPLSMDQFIEEITITFYKQISQ